MNTLNLIKAGGNSLKSLTSYMVEGKKNLKSEVKKMNIKRDKQNVIYSDKLKKIEGKFKAYYIQANDADSLSKINALCIANEKLKGELATLLKEIDYFNASQIKDKSDTGLLHNDKIKSFMNNYLKVSKEYYNKPAFKDHQKALFSFSNVKENMVYLKPCFLFLLGLKKNRVHYLQMLYNLTKTTSPKEQAKIDNAKKQKVNSKK